MVLMVEERLIVWCAGDANRRVNVFDDDHFLKALENESDGQRD
jgi:hypothetical protein